MADWTWSASTRQYRDPATGRFLSPTAQRALRDDSLVKREAVMRTLTGRLASGDLSIQEWIRKMRAAVVQTHSMQYAFGRGGIHAMTAADRTAVARLAQGQMPYLQRFAEQMAAGRLSSAQAEARAALYASASVASYERGKMRAWDVDLPATPGDGGTPCLANCLCTWEFEEDDDEVRASWSLHSGRPCVGCEGRAVSYSPYRVPRQRREAA